MAGVLDFSAILAMLTFDGRDRDALLERYHLPIRHLQLNLQHAADYGLRFDSAIGLKRDLKRAQDALLEQAARPDARLTGRTPVEPTLLLLAPDGQVLQEASDNTLSSRLANELARFLAARKTQLERTRKTSYLKWNGHYVTSLGIFGEEGQGVASLVTIIDAAAIDARVSTTVRKCFEILCAFVLLAVITYVLLLWLVVARRCENDFSTTRFLWVSVLFAMAAQVSMVALVSYMSHERYTQATLEKSEVLVAVANTDVRSALALGVQLEDVDFRQYPWQSLAGEFRELGALDVVDSTGKLVARIDARETTHVASSHSSTLRRDYNPRATFSDYDTRLASFGMAGGSEGSLVARISEEAIRARSLGRVTDGLAAVAVILLVFVELLLVFCRQGGARNKSVSAPGTQPFGLIRPAAFMFLFGIDLSMSFVPLHMETLYEPTLGLSKDFVMGLPISVEFLFVAIAIVVAGAWSDRSGWRLPFFSGVALAALGAMYSWLAPSAMHFIASRAVLGAGYGLTLLASQAFIVANSDSNNKAYGFAQLFAGLYGGSIAGSVAGAMLAEHLGFSPVFLLGSVITLLVLPYAALALPRSISAPAAVARQVRSVAAPAAGTLARWLSNRTMIALILFSSLPASLAAVGFLNYFSPIYLDRFGASQSTIGQILMLYGVCLVFMGPWVSRAVDSASKKRLAVFAGCLLGGAAFLSFIALNGLIAAVVGVLFLGLSHSLVLSAQSAYALALKATRELGEGKALGIFRSSSRIGQMLGPVAFGLVMLSANIEQGIVYFGYAYLAMAVIFWLLTRKDRHLLVEGAG